MYNILSLDVSAIVDIVALVVLIAFAIYSFKTGFIKSFLSLFGSVLSLLFAVLLASKVVVFLESQFGVVASVASGLEGTLTGMFGDKLMNTTLTDATEEFLVQNGIGTWLADIILASQADGSIPLDTTLNQIICPTFAYYVVLILSVIGLFIIFKLIFFLIGEIIKKLHAFKPFAILDKGLGFLLGILRALIVFELIIMVVSIIPLEFAQTLYSEMLASSILGTIHSINLFSIIMQAVSGMDLLSTIKSLIPGAL